MQRAQESEFLHILVLNGMKSLAKERTLQAFFHILRGRKANQTMQDVHLFQLYPYYRLLPHFSKEQWDEILQEILWQNFIQKQKLDQQKDTFVLTEAGEALARAGWANYQLSRWFAIFHEHRWVNEYLPTFWLRLHLLVQTVSHLRAKDPSFYPLVHDRHIQAFVKERLQDREHRKRWLDGLPDELFRALSVIPVEVQPLLVKQWAGAGQTAMTLQQLAYEEKLAPSFVRVKWRYGVAKLMVAIKEHAADLPLLAALLPEGDAVGMQMSKSARETYRLLQKQVSIEEIARMRRIALSTVEDHLVDIALHQPTWDASQFLAEADKQTILEASARLQTRRLRLIKEALQDRYSYLQIRLALAMGEGKR